MNITRDKALQVVGGFAWAIIMLTVIALATICSGCAYRGGKVNDGTNLAIGMKIPGTEWNISILDYVGGVRVVGQDSTRITVTNEVCETNSYFGVVTTRRHSRMTADIEPMETASKDLGTTTPAGRTD